MYIKSFLFITYKALKINQITFKVIFYCFTLTFYLDSGDYDFMGIFYNYIGGKIMNKTPPKTTFL